MGVKHGLLLEGNGKNDVYLRTKYLRKYLAQKETNRQVKGENDMMWSFIISMDCSKNA